MVCRLVQKLYLKATDAGASVDDLCGIIANHFNPPTDNTDHTNGHAQQQQEDGSQVSPSLMKLGCGGGASGAHVVVLGVQALDASTADGESVSASVVTNGEGDASVATATVSPLDPFPD